MVSTELINADSAWEEKAEHQETAAVPSGLCRWLLACGYRAGAARDRRETETKGKGAKVMLSQTVMGIEMKLSGAGMSETLNFREPALIAEEWLSLASSWI